MMKKRFFSLILSIAAVLCGIFAFSACDKKEKEPATEENGLSFQTLTVDGTNVYGKVSNATETFSFLEEITANGASKFIVALDIYGAQQVATKTIPLSVGDNTAYIMETIDGETVKMYTVTVRRRPMYTVSFNSNGGAEVQPQQVEEDSFATEPAEPDKVGYTFEKWNYDFSKPITQNTSVSAAWKARTDTPYKVQYYWENANDNGYTLHETVDLQGETDTTATAQIKSYEHFSHKSTATESGNINGNGSLVLKVYYTREMLTVTFNGYGNETETKNVKYGGKVTAPEFTRTGYTQNGWNMPLPETISENLTLSAEWQINQYTLTLVLGGGKENKTITQDYGSAIEVETPEREGYDFKEWRESDNSWASVVTIPETMPAKNLTVYAWWKINQYSITLVYNNGQNNKTITQDYGSAIKVGAPEREGYTFIGWDSELPDVMPAKNLTFTAEWQINQYTLTLVLGGGLENKTITQDYGSAIENIEILERAGYDFDGWNGVLPETMPAENRTLTASWNAIFTLSESGETITGLTGYGNKKEKVIIPEKIDGVKIAYISSSAFNDCNNSVCIEKDSLKYIGSKTNPYLFLVRASKNLSTYRIENSCQYIGDQAFYECTNLTSIEIPDDVISISYYAFYGCKKLTYNIKNEIKYLGNSKNLYLYLAGVANTNIMAAEIDENCKLIGDYAFSGCSNLTSIKIPNKVITIGIMAFYYCRNLTSITIGNSVCSIGFQAFLECIWLEKVYYKGTAAEWENITIANNNKNFIEAPRYYYSETKPEVEGNFWHYNDKNEIEEW